MLLCEIFKKQLWKYFFRNFQMSELSQTTPSPRPGMSEISKPPPPHLPDVLCRRPLRYVVVYKIPYRRASKGILYTR